MLEARNLTVKYGADTALQGFSCRVKAGECVALTGENGTGKSTALKAIMGLVEYAGGVLLQGDAIDHLPTHKRARAGLIYVPQAQCVFPSLTVAEHLQLWGADRSVTDSVPALVGRHSQLAGSLSGGQQRLLALVGARVRCQSMTGATPFVLLDEPVTGLSVTAKDEIVQQVLLLKAAGAGVLVVEHHAAFVAAVADHTVVLAEE